LNDILVIRSGLEPYGRILDLQRRWAAALSQGLVEEMVWIGHHPPVVTMGKRGDENELHLSTEELTSQGIDLFEIERGGLATVHGPGQLVAYPIISVRKSGLGVKEWVWLLEEAMIQTLARLGVEAGRSELNHGAWVGNEKIGFVGLAIRRGVSLHGLSLNLNPDLSLFDVIVPCGLTGINITSAAVCLGRPVEMEEAGDILGEVLAGLLKRRPLTIDLAEAEERLSRLALEE